MLALRDLHEAHGHIQEIIIQNFRAKPGTRMSGAEEPAFEDHLWTIAVARLIFGPAMSIQAPPNLSAGALESLVAAGINDWGGVSPVTPDHVNPEAPWPHVPALAEATRRAGKHLAERLTIYPSYLRHPDVWVDPSLKAAVLAASDSEGLARTGSWTPGSATPMDLQPAVHRARAASDCIETVLDRALTGRDLQEAEIAALFAARDDSFDRVCAAADELRRNVNGETVTYVVNRNINYTNVCYFKCQFCAFSKGKLSENLRGRPYDLPMEEIVRRAIEAHERGATEVCLQGGIHPDYTGQKYIDIVRALKTAVPQIHVHAFSPLEVWQGAETLGLSVRAFLERLRGEGLGTLPGTAAEILDDEVRAVICPDKINTAQWLKVMAEAHAVGLSTTATIMFGHVDAPLHWARHLLRIRALQRETGGFTEFVPLPFVPMETPLFLKGRARRGPTARETVLMHAVARLALHPHVTNIQASWVKLGRQGVGACLRAGVNDLGGTLMNETISRSAGASHGQELAPAGMEAWIKEAGRTPRQRTTTYGVAPLAQMRSSFDAQPLLEPRLRIDLQYERVPADHSPEQECL
jgi:FO synthase